MKVMVFGASGATGKLLVNQLLECPCGVKIIVRSTAKIPQEWLQNPHIEVFQANVLELGSHKMTELLADCNAVASCLGHNLNFRGIYGEPRKLVLNAAQNACRAIMENNKGKAIKYVLMNTAGNSNRDLNEPISFGQKMVIGLLRWLLPPHVDNEKASDYLRLEIGQDNPLVEWAAVRPDNLIDKEEVSEYGLHASPTRSAIFNPGKTSRINVANFMARLIVDDDLWNKWKGQMPVIYNE